MDVGKSIFNKLVEWLKNKKIWKLNIEKLTFDQQINSLNYYKYLMTKNNWFNLTNLYILILFEKKIKINYENKIFINVSHKKNNLESLLAAM